MLAGNAVTAQIFAENPDDAPWKSAFLLMSSRREFTVFLPFAKSPDQMPGTGTRFRITLPPVGNLSRNTEFMHARVFHPNLFGKFKSMVTPRHFPALPCLWTTVWLSTSISTMTLFARRAKCLLRSIDAG
jgi:hypothetical protein